VVYLATSPAGALVEVLVNLELDPASLPRSYHMLKAEAPQEVGVTRVDQASLPENWREDRNATRRHGDEWLAAAASALLEVPSAILPETFNILLNPRHKDAGRVAVLWHEAYPYDHRLFGARRG